MAINYGGLGPQFFSTQTTPARVQPGYVGEWGSTPSYEIAPAKTTTTYAGPGGTFSQTNGGAWQSPTGTQIGDLPGYLQMRKRMQTGAGFEQYDPQLQNALGLLSRQAMPESTAAGSTFNPDFNMERVNKLLTDPNAIQETPAYQFALQQGNQAINRSAAARGMLNSGNVLAELAKYGQGMASQEYGSQFQRELEAARLAQSGQQGDLAERQFGLNAALSNVNALSDLRNQAMNFGIGSGYYSLPQNQAPYTVGNALVSPNPVPSVW